MLKQNIVLRPVFGAILHFTTLVQQVGIKFRVTLYRCWQMEQQKHVCVVCACNKTKWHYAWFIADLNCCVFNTKCVQVKCVLHFLCTNTCSRMLTVTCILRCVWPYVKRTKWKQEECWSVKEHVAIVTFIKIDVFLRGRRSLRPYAWEFKCFVKVSRVVGRNCIRWRFSAVTQEQ